MSHNRTLRLGRLVLVASLAFCPWASSTGALANAVTTDTTTARTLHASVKTVFEDGTIVLEVGGRLVPVRLDGVVPLPGAYQAMLAALPSGVRVRYQVVKKGPPATVLLWRSALTLQEELLKKKVVLKR
ncbi:hypothetical protein [Deinococcus yavapaiensis]|uniref:Uncharacterized protein n=1 Tax=Deinococcus yavapaiensis KR-236 TaxID=694435 RepID=A0A318S5P4_9DEIO|nr:hypothetical protein [Deinococcus yavapaiensis]PYE53030.1 hypothetical protein DES52_11013 [Deinococcus yavapaiensis KR-236]